MNFTLNVLGTASALPTTERYPSAQVLNVRGRLFMIDCGEGAQVQMRKAGLSFLKLEHICISHIHGDHVFGLFGLLSTMGMLGRTSVLNIYAPEPVREVLEHFLIRFGEGFLFEINFVPLRMKEPQIVYENRTVELLAFPLNHRVDTCGFIIREKIPQLNVRKDAIRQYGLTLAEIGALKRGEDVVREDDRSGHSHVILNADAAYRPYEPRSYAYCSDTAPFPELVGWIRGVSLLYHEATFPAGMEDMAARTFHSTTLQAARTAQEAGVGKLIVGHYSSRFPSVDFFLDELRTIFPEAQLAHDMDVFELPLLKNG
ncbi:MAG: ribonuclease Z [Bacteroidales bacterium]|nr:ribonuclease Z [Bacteroidales bacterium]